MLDVYKLIECYYPKGSLAYEILIKHSEDVTNKAIAIAERKTHLAIDKDFVREAGMLHDIGIFKTNAPKIACFGLEPYIRHGYLGAELLRSLGYDKHALVCERHTGSGLTMNTILEQKIDLPNGIYYPISIEEKLICYADKFFSKTKLGQEKSLDKVFRSMTKFGEESLQRFQALHELFD